jgi:hypothetical protein
MWRRAGRNSSTAGRAPQASVREVAAAGAIRRVPKYAGRVEMEQIGVAQIITTVQKAPGMPRSDDFLKINNDFGMFAWRLRQRQFRFS